MFVPRLLSVAEVRVCANYVEAYDIFFQFSDDFTGVMFVHLYSQLSVNLQSVFCFYVFAFSALNGWLDGRKGILPVKTVCWFVGGGDLTGALSYN